MTGITAIAILAMFPLCMIFATFYDLFTMTIPNKICIALVVGFAVLAPLAGMSLETAAWHIGVAFFVLVVGYVFFSFGFMGGGDAKLLAASALWFGTAFTAPYLLIASIMGGALTIMIIIARRMPLPPRLATIGWVARLHDRSEGVPYGAALGPAAMLVFTDSNWMEFITSGQLIG
ncbi:MAG: prepilin peptidase [Pseudomonadota bacterium]